jgi:AICAR transformylase/IMP cyclohydrolase PurH
MEGRSKERRGCGVDSEYSSSACSTFCSGVGAGFTRRPDCAIAAAAKAKTTTNIKTNLSIPSFPLSNRLALLMHEEEKKIRNI